MRRSLGHRPWLVGGLCFLLTGCTPLMPPMAESTEQGQEKPAFAEPTAPMNQGVLRFALSEHRAVWSMNPRSMVQLADLIERETHFRAEPLNGGRAVQFADKRLYTVPVFFVDNPAEEDWAYLIDYLLAGGFAVGELTWGFSSAFSQHAGLVSGDDIWIAPLTLEHPVFSYFYDLQEGVVTDVEQSIGAGKAGIENVRKLAFTGYFVQGRLAGVSSQPPLSFLPNRFAAEDKLTSQGKAIINIMVYALGQKDGLTQRLMSSDQDPASIEK